jgi:hypothetical protein
MRQHPKNREAIIPAVAYIWLAFYALAVVHSFVSPRTSATVTAQNEEIAIR